MWFISQVLNLFLALLLNAFDNGDEDDEEEENDDDNEEAIFKKFLTKLTQTKKTVISVTDFSFRPENCSSSQDIQTIVKDNEGKNSGKSACRAVGM